MSTAQLFSRDQAPRRSRIHRMHVADAGWHAGRIAIFRCSRCGHQTDWLPFDTIAEAKRGLPCPKCNEAVTA